MSKKKKQPVIPPYERKTDETKEPTGEDLRYNEQADSFELDPASEDTEYQHSEPYNTEVPRGEDHMSTYDEANPYTPGEYRDKQDELGNDQSQIELDAVDEQLAETSEDERGDLDEEGYPLRDDADGQDNPVTDEPTD